MNIQKHTVSPRLIWGDWSKDTVRLDWDDTPLNEVKLWGFRALNWFKLEGFIILESSRKNYVIKVKGKILFKYVKSNYLVIFSRHVKWDLNVRIMNWVALESKNSGLQRYIQMQCIKKTSTVRISSKGDKPSPRIVFRYGCQDGQIEKFLETRRFILDSLRKMKRGNSKDEMCKM
jgi:hypothetical protein